MLKLETTNPRGPEPPGARERLSALREALLHLHKALLESERISYEAAFGHISSPYQFLHLATKSPWFAWLAPVTRLIATTDEILDRQGAADGSRRGGAGAGGGLIAGGLGGGRRVLAALRRGVATQPGRDSRPRSGGESDSLKN